ncbi:amino acid transporter [Fomitiporia mediterranea MF3/22]|uniref:amino acid transporter n=1 Tax=Fomitiporia mediterranea (strain MF3/22) TaxID=694068 RepID=UPI0004407DCC|nr:amino acid transporter [Fomitiporia mediterranea MF3/22]EJD06899.1 amino acid transporter [Fomitiporia mediterranea MF3/22]
MTVVPPEGDVEYAQDNIEAVEEDESASLLGAPVEKINPLGREVTLLSCIMLNLGQMLGSGIFSVPGVVLNSVGSIGLFFIAWVLAPVFAYAGLSLYSELASMFPNRSGAEVVYLEQAYPRPRFLVPVSFAVTTVLLSFSATNSIVFAQYFMILFDIPATAARQTVIALIVATVAVAVVGISTKWSLRVVNVITGIKALSQIFMVAAGLAVLVGITRIKDPFSNFADPWADSSLNGNALATAFVKTHFAFVGWANSFNVLAEVKREPVRTVRNAGRISLVLVSVLFLLTNVAYIAAIPKEEIKQSGQLVGALFFQKVFGETWTAKILPVMVVFSCFGNVTVGQARVIREVARQGLLPWPEFFASTKPFGTPLGPVLLKHILTILVILALPAADAFNFLLDLASYPHLFFAVATGFGVWILRKRHVTQKIPFSGFKASNVSIVLYLSSCIFLTIMPWIPPEDGHADVSFWYCVVGIGILLVCALYYYVWIVLIPRIGGYEYVEEVEEIEGGARLAKLVRKYHSHSTLPDSSPSERDPLL